MGRIIWEQECIQAATPYYAELAGINIWNIEELRYYLKKYFYLIENSFFNDDLVRFLSDEMKRQDLGRMISMARGKSDPVNVAGKLIISIGNESEDAQNAWRKRVSDYARIPEVQRRLMKAQALYELHHIAQSERAYMDILKDEKMGKLQLTNEESGKICYRLAFINLESLSWKAAGEYLQEAYGLLGYEAILKELYTLTCMSSEVICDSSLFQEISPRRLRDWQQEYEKLRDKVRHGFPLSGYEQLSNGTDGGELRESKSDRLEKWQSDFRKIRKNSCQETVFSV